MMISQNDSVPLSDQGSVRYVTAKEKTEVAQLIDAEELPLQMPVSACNGQDSSLITERLRQGGLGRQKLVMRVLEDGYFLLYPNLSGTLLTKDFEVIASTAQSTFLRSAPDYVRRFRNEAPRAVFNEVFLGFDGYWYNYFHWLIFCLGRTALARDFVSPKCVLAVPEYPEGTMAAFTKKSREQSLHYFNLTDRITSLAPGFYKARKIFFPDTVSENEGEERKYEPTDQLRFRALTQIFGQVRERLPSVKEYPSRLFISREFTSEQRLTPAEKQETEAFCLENQLTTINTEFLDFETQATLLKGAEFVLGAHGAGLTNILFGSSQLKILELQRRIRGDLTLRPWFYMLASGAGMNYAFLNGDKGEIRRDRLSTAFRALQLASRKPAAGQFMTGQGEVFQQALVN